MVLVFGLIVVVVVGIVFRFIGGGGNTGGGGDSDGVAGATGGTSMKPIEDADIVQVTIVSSSTMRETKGSDPSGTPASVHTITQKAPCLWSK